GDGLALVTGILEIVGGGGAASGGGTLCVTGVGCIVGAPAVAGGVALGLHGSATSSSALTSIAARLGVVFHSSSENSGNNEQQPPRQQREVYDEQGKRWTEADVSGQTGTWNKGTYENPEASLLEHFKKHGREVDAKDPLHYLRKAEGFKGNARKRSRKTAVEGGTPGVMRYSKNGLYIDMTPNNQIISFGATNN
ncbi:hypothetical protein, partial [Nostoc sp. NMS9]